MEKITGELTAPDPLNAGHVITSFDCGRSSLSEWLLRRARRNETPGDSRTYVVGDTYSLSLDPALAESPSPAEG